MSAQKTNRRCPKCGGNIFLYNGFDGWYEQCLQCSLIRYLDVVFDNKNNVKVDAETSSEISNGTAS